jgi:hypothetical protein
MKLFLVVVNSIDEDSGLVVDFEPLGIFKLKHNAQRVAEKYNEVLSQKKAKASECLVCKFRGFSYSSFIDNKGNAPECFELGITHMIKELPSFKGEKEVCLNYVAYSSVHCIDGAYVREIENCIDVNGRTLSGEEIETLTKINFI